MGKSERDAVRSQVRRILLHFLKLAYSPARDPRFDWMDSIDDARAEIEDKLSATLRRDIEEADAALYGIARKRTAVHLQPLWRNRERRSPCRPNAPIRSTRSSPRTGIPSRPTARMETTHDPGPFRHPHHRHDAQPGRAGLRPDPRVSRRRRDQAGRAEGRRCRAYRASRKAGHRQPVFPLVQRQQAQPDAEPEDRRRKAAVQGGRQAVGRAARKFRPRRDGTARARLGRAARPQPAADLRDDQGLRQLRPATRISRATSRWRRRWAARWR